MASLALTDRFRVILREWHGVLTEADETADVKALVDAVLADPAGIVETVLVHELSNLRAKEARAILAAGERTLKRAIPPPLRQVNKRKAAMRKYAKDYYNRKKARRALEELGIAPE